MGVLDCDCPQSPSHTSSRNPEPSNRTSNLLDPDCKAAHKRARSFGVLPPKLTDPRTTPHLSTLISKPARALDPPRHLRSTPKTLGLSELDVEGSKDKLMSSRPFVCLHDIVSPSYRMVRLKEKCSSAVRHRFCLLNLKLLLANPTLEGNCLEFESRPCMSEATCTRRLRKESQRLLEPGPLFVVRFSISLAPVTCSQPFMSSSTT